MSCYEWEAGEIHIPASQWARFRTELLRKWNERQTANWELAKDAHKAAKEAAKGKRGESRTKAIRESLAKSAGGRLDKWGLFEAPRKRSQWWGGVEEDSDASTRWEMLQSHCLDGWGKSANLVKTQPKKKDFGLKALTKSASLYSGDAHISFNNENSVVVWHVSENNHACERAHEWWFAKELFKALGRIKWTRNSGGQIVGNDEYNRDADYAGGGANYIKQNFGFTSQF